MRIIAILIKIIGVLSLGFYLWMLFKKEKKEKKEKNYY